MRTSGCWLPTQARVVVSKFLMTALVAFSFPTLTFATPRETLRRDFSGEALNPFALSIVVNVTGDGDNLNPTTGCDTDPATPGDQCSLRAAIQQANAVPGDDEITFNIPASQPNCTAGSCLINLGAPLPALATNVRIDGGGADKVRLRRGLGGDYRIFTVTSATEITIAGMAISGGRPAGVSSGGALANAGDATVNIVNAHISGNTAGATGGDGGAIANGNSGTINILNSVLTDNVAPVPVVDNANGGGGAIVNYSNGTVNITNSFIAANKAQGGRVNSIVRGGAIHNVANGTVNITGSILLANQVLPSAAAGNQGGGGAISNSADGTVNIMNSSFGENLVSGSAQVLLGGAIQNTAATGRLNVTNSVFYTNIVHGGTPTSGGGAIFSESPNATVSNSTFTGNRGMGGGLKGQGTVKSSIIAKNNLGLFAGSDVSGTFTSAGYNLIGNAEGATGFTMPTDQKGTVASPLDPKLDPNGVNISYVGTEVAVPGIPLCDSPAVDKGSSAGLTTDIRGNGFPRTIDDPNQTNEQDGTDVGAFERPACAQLAMIVNSSGDADDVNPGDGNCDSDAAMAGPQCTLRAALREANAVAGDYVINFGIPTSDPGFDPATGRHTINLTSALPTVDNSNLILNGPAADRLTIRRNTGGFYRIFTFGGVVENVTMSGLTISNGFSTSANGGAVSFIGKSLNINDCVFTGNTSVGSGGAVYAAANVKVTVTGSTFTANFSSASSGFVGGGAIYASGALSVANSNFNSNVASGLGGAINNDNSFNNTNSTITNSQFDGNSADAGGGFAVSNLHAVMQVTDCTFQRNSSTLINAKGGAIYLITGSMTVMRSTLSTNENYAIDINGGASRITAEIVDSTISENTGGGIQADFASTATNRVLNLINSTVSNNTTGAGLSLSRITLNVTNSTISHNEGPGIQRMITDNTLPWTVRSSIIAANAMFADVTGTFTSGGFNLVGNADPSTGFVNGVNSDQVGSSGAPLDARFDSGGLQNHGGPTKTLALRPDSPAIDKGNANGLIRMLTTDQRGMSRTFDDPAVPNGTGDGTDIGPFELQPGAPTPTPTPTPTPSPSPSPSPAPFAKLTVTTTSMVRTSCGDIAVGVTLQNTGNVAATNVRLSLASLSQPLTNGGPLPKEFGTLAPGQWATTVVFFSGVDNPAGANRILTLQGGFTGGAFTLKRPVTLP